MVIPLARQREQSHLLLPATTRPLVSNGRTGTPRLTLAAAAPSTDPRCTLQTQVSRTLFVAATALTAADAFQLGASAPGTGGVTRGSVRMAEAAATKRDERRRIMGKNTFMRGATPFEKGIHADVNQKMSAKFASELVEELKESTFKQISRGEGEKQIVFKLANDYGFCWGVERSIELAWAARDAYPDKTVHITNELIHNPGVNDMLHEMDVKFIEKLEDGGKGFDTVGDGDVVILPAFGASLEEMQLLDERGVTIVDTTCPWVSKVWTTVDKHKKAEMSSIIHGKWAHEESIATASMAEDYIIIKDIKEAEEIASYILGEEGCLTDEQLLDKYKNAISKGFDPKKHLKRLGLANQTTMYKKETQAIGKLFERVMIEKYGPENSKERFIAFDTICDATQVRQDAISEMISAEDYDLDFILVVGGWDSSNTAHLLEIPVHEGKVGYHVKTADCIRADGSIEHRTVDGEIVVAENVLPKGRAAKVGITSGASTPDSVVQECLEQLIMLKQLSPVA